MFGGRHTLKDPKTPNNNLISTANCGSKTTASSHTNTIHNTPTQVSSSRRAAESTSAAVAVATAASTSKAAARRSLSLPHPLISLLSSHTSSNTN